jgi:hypothetical protein
VRQGNLALRRALVEAARAAVKAKDTYLQAQYRRLLARRGSNRAIVAVAHSIVQIVYYILVRKEPYRELGGDYFDKQRPADTTRRLVTRLEKLGYKVTLETGETLLAA